MDYAAIKHCENCGEELETKATEEEANAEAEALFGIKNASTNKECAVICDDCFQLLFPQGKPHT